MRTRNITLLWATQASGNLGVNALTLAAVATLEEAATLLGERFLYQFIGTGSRQPGIQQLSGPGFPRPVDVRFEPSWQLAWQQALRGGWGRQRRLLAEADLICDLGQGDSFSDVYGLKRFGAVAWPQAAAALLGRPVVLLPQTLGPFRSRVARFAARRLLRRARAVHPRDPLSADLLARLAPRQVVAPYLDMAFTLPLVPAAPLPGSGPLVGLNVSGLLWNGGYSGGNMFGLAAPYRETVLALARWLTGAAGARLLLVPHVVTSPGDVEHDPDACAALAALVPATVLPGSLDPRVVKGQIATCDAFLGSRMHACIAAYSAGVPVLPLAYSRKFAGLFEHSLSWPLNGDLRRQGPAEILRLAGELLGRRVELAGRLADDRPRIAADHRRLVESLARLIGDLP